MSRQKACASVAHSENLRTMHRLLSSRVAAVQCGGGLNDGVPEVLVTLCSRHPRWKNERGRRPPARIRDTVDDRQGTGKHSDAPQKQTWKFLYIYISRRPASRVDPDKVCKVDLAPVEKTGTRAGRHLPTERPRAPSFRTRCTRRNTSHNKYHRSGYTVQTIKEKCPTTVLVDRLVYHLTRGRLGGFDPSQHLTSLSDADNEQNAPALAS